MSPSSRQWLHLVLVVVLSLGIAGFVQAIADRHSARVDLTPTKSFSLSEPTRRALSLLDDPIHVTVYYAKEDLQEIASLMDLFEGAAPNFHVTLLALDRYPGRARQDGIDRYGKAVIRYRDETLVVDASREQTVAGALLRLARGRPTRILFLQGHGERDVADVVTPRGYGELRQTLQQESHVVGTANLLQLREIPTEVDLVVVAGAKNDLLESEADALDRYLAAGGHVVVLLDPVPLPNLERLVRRHGVDTWLDIVRDSSNQIMGSDPFTIPVPAFRGHAITASQSTPALFAVARSVAGRGKEGATVATVAESYPEAWAMRDFERAGDPKAAPLEGRDQPGPIPVMAAASWPVGGDREARLVVAGDSDFAANGFLNLLGNRDLLLNAITWAVSAEALIAGRSGSEIEALRPLSPLVLSGTQGRWVFLVSVVLQPALVLAFGSVIALRRRWQG